MKNSKRENFPIICLGWLQRFSRRKNLNICGENPERIYCRDYGDGYRPEPVRKLPDDLNISEQK